MTSMSLSKVENNPISDYRAFIDRKTQFNGGDGIKPVSLPDYLFPFQADLIEWALIQGRAALFEDCGLGKSIQELIWCDQIVRKTNRPVLLLTPLAVTHQMIAEAEKFGIDAKRSTDGTVYPGINVTNYEKLHLFDWKDFSGMCGDESGILKSFNGVYKSQITEFMRKLRYRLLATATAAPNDYIELGTHSEALGYLGYMDMLGRFFKNDQNTIKPMSYLHRGKHFADVRNAQKWRFKGHAEQPFWQWVVSWARAVRMPSDLGYEDNDFILPPLIQNEHLIETEIKRDGMLFNLPAVGLKEQREERRLTIEERCEKVSQLVAHDKPALVWCHLNAEGDLLERLIPDAVQVSGSDSDSAKEEKLLNFAAGNIRVLVTKPKIGAWGLNFQHCAHITFFPSHSFEQWYQAVRRCWRFGQKNSVVVDIVTTEGEQGVLNNLQKKQAAADRMFGNLVAHMSNALHIERCDKFEKKTKLPAWMGRG